MTGKCSGLFQELSAVQDLNPAQRKALATMLLEFYQKCAMEEQKLITGMISVINNLESKG